MRPPAWSPGFTINTALIVVVEMPLLRALEGCNTDRALALGALLLCGGNGLLPVVGSLGGPVMAWVALTVVVWTVGEMLVFPLMSAWVANRATDRNRGRYMGIYSIAFGASSAVAPIGGTAIYSQLGPDALWLTSLAIGVVAAFAIRRYTFSSKPAAQHP